MKKILWPGPRARLLYGLAAWFIVIPVGSVLMIVVAPKSLSPSFASQVPQGVLVIVCSLALIAGPVYVGSALVTWARRGDALDRAPVPAAAVPPPPDSPAGWYPNPDGPGRRYWNGAGWTNDTAP